MQLTKNRVPLRSSLFAGFPVLLVVGGSATKVAGGQCRSRKVPLGT